MKKADNQEVLDKIEKALQDVLRESTKSPPPPSLPSVDLFGASLGSNEQFKPKRKTLKPQSQQSKASIEQKDLRTFYIISISGYLYLMNFPSSNLNPDIYIAFVKEAGLWMDLDKLSTNTLALIHKALLTIS